MYNVHIFIACNLNLRKTENFPWVSYEVTQENYDEWIVDIIYLI